MSLSHAVYPLRGSADLVLSLLIHNLLDLREFVKTSVILTPGALLVGCEPQFVLHFRGIRGIRGIRGGAQKLIFEQ